MVAKRVEREILLSAKKSNLGFTLLELLAVLAVIVLVLSVGWPAMQRLLARNRLDSVTRELQAELYRTRLEAMRNAAPYVFRYQPGTGVYEILPKEAIDREIEQTYLGAESLSSRLSDPATPTAPLDTAPFNTGPINTGLPLEKRSPTDLESTMLEQTTDAGGTSCRKTLPEPVRFAPPAPARRSNTWSAAILFYPNGRTSGASLTLRTNDRYGFQKTLEIRGLTGSVSQR
ncbi:MAG TPA: hypothetical protein DEB39_00465 [Planctomycetaceae bacterium]|nr:hypothetical protein [Planctomycetaceae bacterium]